MTGPAPAQAGSVSSKAGAPARHAAAANTSKKRAAGESLESAETKKKKEKKVAVEAGEPRDIICEQCFANPSRQCTHRAGVDGGACTECTIRCKKCIGM
jgi:hypothetical protein